MSEPVQAAITPLKEVEDMLAKYIATPVGTTPESFKPNSQGVPAAKAQDVLVLVGNLLKLTYGIGGVGTVGTELAKGLMDAAMAIVQVGDALASLTGPKLAGRTPEQVVQNIRSALALAQTLLPGGSPALAAGNQFFAQVANLLADMSNDVTAARTLLYRLAQELLAIRAAIKP